MMQAVGADPLNTKTMPPQPPPPPEIEGYLKKLKRKTSNLTGSWNKRWFFVDPKRLEFGYSATKAPNTPKSSIYLNDITAVLQFDDTHFQVESRTRNFFLCGESKASTTCWVKSLDDYRKKLREYEKEMVKFSVSDSAGSSAGNSSCPTNSPYNTTNQARANKKAAQRKKTPPNSENPARDSLQDSSSASASIGASSSSNLGDEKLGRHGALDEVAASDEHRTPSPIDSSRRLELRESRSRTGNSGDRVRERERDGDGNVHGRIQDRERDRDYNNRGRESDRDRGSRERKQHERDPNDDRTSKRDRSTTSQRRANGKTPSSSPHPNPSRTSSRSGTGSSNPSYTSHPTHGYVMHAWIDEYE